MVITEGEAAASASYKYRPISNSGQLKDDVFKQFDIER